MTETKKSNEETRGNIKTTYIKPQNKIKTLEIENL